jgi:hypothetical protein
VFFGAFLSGGNNVSAHKEIVQSHYNRLYVNNGAWNSFRSGGVSFQAGLSNTTWYQGLYWNTLYIYGQSFVGNNSAATYITNFKIWLVTPYGNQMIYEDKYLLINYDETRAVTNLYCTSPNCLFFITWDNCSTF